MRYLFLLLFLTGCREKKADYYLDKNMIERGRNIYRMNCMYCHGSDPGLGGHAPPIKGSSGLLLKEKVLYGSYPDGYIPQRTTRDMPKFPSLEKELKPLEMFLNNI